jgi:hypothetical protein
MHLCKASNTLQSWLFARDYCCSLGLKIASFATKNHAKDAFDAAQYVGNILLTAL